jgi:hypothetical protein
MVNFCSYTLTAKNRLRDSQIERVNIFYTGEIMYSILVSLMTCHRADKPIVRGAIDRTWTGLRESRCSTFNFRVDGHLSLGGRCGHKGRVSAHATCAMPPYWALKCHTCSGIWKYLASWLVDREISNCFLERVGPLVEDNLNMENSSLSDDVNWVLVMDWCCKLHSCNQPIKTMCEE